MVRTTNERVSTDSGDSSRLRRRAERLKFGPIARAQHRPVVNLPPIPAGGFVPALSVVAWFRRIRHRHVHNMSCCRNPMLDLLSLGAAACDRFRGRIGELLT